MLSMKDRLEFWSQLWTSVVFASSQDLAPRWTYVKEQPSCQAVSFIRMIPLQTQLPWYIYVGVHQEAVFQNCYKFVMYWWQVLCCWWCCVFTMLSRPVLQVFLNKNLHILMLNFRDWRCFSLEQIMQYCYKCKALLGFFPLYLKAPSCTEGAGLV